MLYRFLLNVHKNVWLNSLRYVRANEKHSTSSVIQSPGEEIRKLTKRFFKRSVKLPCPSPKDKLKQADTVIINAAKTNNALKKELSDVARAKEDVQAMSDQNQITDGPRIIVHSQQNQDEIQEDLKMNDQNQKTDTPRIIVHSQQNKDSIQEDLKLSDQNQKTDSPRNIVYSQQNKDRIKANLKRQQQPFNVKLSKADMEKEKMGTKSAENNLEENDNEEQGPGIITPTFNKYPTRFMDRKEFIDNLNEIGAKQMEESKSSPKYKFVFEIKKSKNTKRGHDIQVEIKASESLKKLQGNPKENEEIEMFEVESSGQPKEAAAIDIANEQNSTPTPEQTKPAPEYPNSCQRTLKPLQLATYNAIKHHEHLIEMHYKQLEAQKRNLQHAEELVTEHSRMRKAGKKR